MESGVRSVLRRRAGRQGLEFEPFDIETDYLAYVDGRPRYDGVRTFLAARGIDLPEGSDSDQQDAETVRAIGERKTRLFRQALQQGIDPAPGAQVLLRELRHAGIGIAVGSSSENCAAILRAARLDDLIDARVDGLDAEQLELPGKPDPAVFLEAARRLGVQPSRAILFEDALAGIEAGKRGGFECVVGIDHGQQRRALRQRGADVVINNLGEVHVEETS